MPAERIIINASPLIVLFKSRLEEILPKLFNEIIIPKNVFDEVTTNLKNDRAAVEIKKINWCKIIDVDINNEIAAWDLGKGESSVLSYALEKRQYFAVIDDKAARKCAMIFTINVLGTGSILVLAKKKGIIPSVGEALQKLKNSGYWISENLENYLKSSAEE